MNRLILLLLLLLPLVGVGQADSTRIKLQRADEFGIYNDKYGFVDQAQFYKYGNHWIRIVCDEIDNYPAFYGFTYVQLLDSNKNILCSIKRKSAVARVLFTKKKVYLIEFIPHMNDLAFSQQFGINELLVSKDSISCPTENFTKYWSSLSFFFQAPRKNEHSPIFNRLYGFNNQAVFFLNTSYNQEIVIQPQTNPDTLQILKNYAPNDIIGLAGWGSDYMVLKKQGLYFTDSIFKNISDSILGVQYFEPVNDSLAFTVTDSSIFRLFRNKKQDKVLRLDSLFNPNQYFYEKNEKELILFSKGVYANGFRKIINIPFDSSKSVVFDSIKTDLKLIEIKTDIAKGYYVAHHTIDRTIIKMQYLDSLGNIGKSPYLLSIKFLNDSFLGTSGKISVRHRFTYQVKNISTVAISKFDTRTSITTDGDLPYQVYSFYDNHNYQLKPGDSINISFDVVKGLYIPPFPKSIFTYQIYLYVNLFAPNDTLSGFTNSLMKRFSFNKKYIITSIMVSEEQNNPLTIYPNPAKDIVFIETDEAIKQIRVMDAMGKVIEVWHNKKEIVVRGYPKGIYILKVETERGNIVTQKLIKE